MKRGSTESQESAARYKHLNMHSTLVSVSLKLFTDSHSTYLKSVLLSLSVDYREAVSKLRTVDVNAVSGTLKLYFRELPLPLIPSEQFKELADALGEPFTHPNTQLHRSVHKHAV